MDDFDIGDSSDEMVMEHDLIEPEPDNFSTNAIKPTILTHAIDGFIIEESLSPFEPEISSLLSSQQLRMIRIRQQMVVSREKDGIPVETGTRRTSLEQNRLSEIATATCEQCGFSGPRVRFSLPSRRFCSLGCARMQGKADQKNSNLKIYRPPVQRRGRPKGSFSNRMYSKRKQGYTILRKSPTLPMQSLSDSNSFSDCEDCNGSTSGIEEWDSAFSCSSSPSPEPEVTQNGIFQMSPMKWSVDDVWKYVKSFPDSASHAEDFKAHEIDGAALLLLHEEHLLTSMSIPLGPALKLSSHIDKLRRSIN